MIKTHKRKKCTRMRATSTHGGGARKKRKKSGHKGGVGMAGTGKRADQKKTLVNKLYGHNYFGKRGITSKGTKRDIRKRINIYEIDSNLERYLKKGLAKKTPKGFEINLKDYKILGGSKRLQSSLNNKLFIKVKEASASAIKIAEENEGKIIIQKNRTNKEE